VLTRQAVDATAGAAEGTRYFANAVAGQFVVLRDDRTVNQTDHHVGVALCALHQGRQPDEIQGIHDARDET